ncbi:hypothetical protein HMPREF0281_00828 [Corynebacterium ammoniagenes DSM 20306]|uniref:Uncharacterized protein n=1 Tax=Corynebacterium ammoniagenes DSM 20306 TaxID=649754 RepID=A0ABN0AH06_CORAM|nr:hypothetical protein HMPREF0281_00828 [Corynebacterium ammoniagenes DSM 20306]
MASVRASSWSVKSAAEIMTMAGVAAWVIPAFHGKICTSLI